MSVTTIIHPSVCGTHWTSYILPLFTLTSTVGSEPLDVLAERIWTSVGPSGRNKVRSTLSLPFTSDDGYISVIFRTIYTASLPLSEISRQTRMTPISMH
jgi:hypothetical protein